VFWRPTKDRDDPKDDDGGSSSGARGGGSLPRRRGVTVVSVSCDACAGRRCAVLSPSAPERAHSPSIKRTVHSHTRSLVAGVLATTCSTLFLGTRTPRRRGRRTRRATSQPQRRRTCRRVQPRRRTCQQQRRRPCRLTRRRRVSIRVGRRLVRRRTCRRTCCRHRATLLLGISP